MPNSPESFRKNCKALLEKLGWSQADLAEEIGVSRPNVSKYLSGDTVPGLEVVDRFAEAFGVSAAELVNEGSVPEPRVSRSDLPAEIARAIEEAVQRTLGIPRDVLTRLATVKGEEWDLVRAGLGILQLPDQDAEVLNESKKKGPHPRKP